MPKPTCSIEECNKPVAYRGWCGMHVTRWKRHGTTDERRLFRTKEETFRFYMPGDPPPEGVPWIWTGNVNQGNGYGRLRGDGRYQPAHRVSYEIFNGPIPEGLIVRHKTDIPLDVNPRNLELGTVADNARDRVERERQIRGEQHFRAVLIPHIVRVMRAAHANGRTIASLAREYQVGESTVRAVVQRRTWKHI